MTKVTDFFRKALKFFYPLANGSVALREKTKSIAVAQVHQLRKAARYNNKFSYKLFFLKMLTISGFSVAQCAARASSPRASPSSTTSHSKR